MSWIGWRSWHGTPLMSVSGVVLFIFMLSFGSFFIIQRTKRLGHHGKIKLQGNWRRWCCILLFWMVQDDGVIILYFDPLSWVDAEFIVKISFLIDLGLSRCLFSFSLAGWLANKGGRRKYLDCR